MKTSLHTGIIFILFLIFTFFIPVFSQGVIIDHTCTDLSQIPASWIDSVQAKIKWHYAHTSHGGQLSYGLEYIEDDDAGYNIIRQSSSLPTGSDALCIFDGQEHDTYITPDEYWETGTGMNYTRAVLTNNPTLNISQWSWCTQQDGNSEEATQAYLDSIAVLEDEFPEVTFIYMTGNAQATGSSGYNRYLRNEQIRNYCRDNNKALFDFADLDAWYYNASSQQWEHSTYEYNGNDIPVENPQFNGDEEAHTTYSSCRQKGRAVWWMMAVLAGWEPVTSGNMDHTSSNPSAFQFEQNYPNPFNPFTKIQYRISKGDKVTLKIYDVQGREVGRLVEKYQAAGSYTYQFDGSGLTSGVYFYTLKIGDIFTQTKKMTLIR